MIFQFILDRTLFITLFGLYIGWFHTTGPSTWTQLYETTSDFHLLIFGTVIVSSICYATFSLMFGIIDMYLLPKGTVDELRVQPKVTPTWSMYRKALPVAFFNVGILGLPIGYFTFFFLHPASPKYIGSATHLYASLPDPSRLLWDIIVCIMVEEVLFYYTHRLFHVPFLYAKFHKRHHEFTAPIGISAVYTTPLDFAITNIFPLLVGPIITNAHPVTVWGYFIEAIINTIVTHGGYRLPGVPNPKMHDAHHELFKWNFGVIGLMDILHGTDIGLRHKGGEAALPSTNSK